MIQEAQEKVVKIHEDIVDLKGIRRHFKEELRRMIESHIRMLDFDSEREAEDQEQSPGTQTQPQSPGTQSYQTGAPLKEFQLTEEFPGEDEFEV